MTNYWVLGIVCLIGGWLVVTDFLRPPPSTEMTSVASYLEEVNQLYNRDLIKRDVKPPGLGKVYLP